MQLPYHYPKNNLHKTVLVVLGLFGLVLLGFSFAAGQQIKGARSIEDSRLFLWLALGLLIAGFLFILPGLVYYRRMQNFYNTPEFYGVIISNSQLTNKEFTGFGKRTWKLHRSEVVKTTERRYKGLAILTIETNKRHYYLPIGRLSPADADAVRKFFT
jgi:hypothetical protein